MSRILGLMMALALIGVAGCGGKGEFEGGRPADASLVATVQVTGDQQYGEVTSRVFTSNTPYPQTLINFENYVAHKGGDRRLVDVGGRGERFDSNGKCVRLNPWNQDLSRTNLSGKLTDAQIKRLDDAIGSFVETVPKNCEATRLQ